MDKNTWIGFGLIAAILIGFSFYNRPSKEEIARRQQVRDSLALVAQQKALEAEVQHQLDSLSEAEVIELTAADSLLRAAAAEAALRAQYGVFSVSAEGENHLMTVENDLCRYTFSSKGGVLYAVELKDYKAYGDTVNPLCLFRGDERRVSFTLVTANNRVLSTENLYFTALPVRRDTTGAQIVTMRLRTEEPGAWLDFVYTLSADDYMIGFDIVAHGLKGILADNLTSLEMQWAQRIPQQERGRTFEDRYARLQYMFINRDMEQLSESKNDREKESGTIRWIAFKDQFFSSVMIAEDGFQSSELQSERMPQQSGYVKSYQATTSVAFDVTGQKATSFRYYLGPNKYSTLRAYDKGKQRYEELRLKELVPLGWSLVSWVNKILTIPMFDLFTRWGLPIGLVIFLMTLVIKLIILPLTFKSYKSSAKMRALKPQIDAINARIPADKAMERQQATMALYQQAGASPMAGCLPMLLQMPVVMAMFFFFPTAIELRGQSFLWADDLSTFDAILSWDVYIPILSGLLDNHLSLFTLLFTLVNVFYTYVNFQTQPSAGDEAQQKMMKWMMYLMPLIFFFTFNNYAAGLSYYYFLSLLMSIIQTYIFRWTLDDKRMLLEIEKDKQKRAKKAAKNAGKPKLGFMARLEEMQREQQRLMREQMKEQAKNARR